LQTDTKHYSAQQLKSKTFGTTGNEGRTGSADDMPGTVLQQSDMFAGHAASLTSSADTAVLTEHLHSVYTQHK